MGAIVQNRSLQSYARSTLPGAVALLRARGGTLGDAVYVAMDAGRPPAKELALRVLSEGHPTGLPGAKKELEERLRKAADRNVPVILTAMVSQETLVTSIETCRLARDVRRWLATEPPPGHARVVTLAGGRVGMEHVPLSP